MRVETITSRSNPLAARLRALGRSAEAREETGEYLCDGPKLLEEALRAGADIRAALFAPGADIPPLPEGVRAARVPEDLLRAASPVETPQGVLFSVRRHPAPLPERLRGARYLVLDGVQDPGNVGTILRTADAFGCDGVFLLEGCAGLYHPKTVRASMGAVFRQPAFVCPLERLDGLLTASALPLCGASLTGETVLGQVPLGRAAVAVGSEGRGLREEVRARCGRTVRIPMRPRCESLNAAAAAAVLLWEMAKETGEER